MISDSLSASLETSVALVNRYTLLDLSSAKQPKDLVLIKHYAVNSLLVDRVLWTIRYGSLINTLFLNLSGLLSNGMINCRNQVCKHDIMNITY